MDFQVGGKKQNKTKKKCPSAFTARLSFSDSDFHLLVWTREERKHVCRSLRPSFWRPEPLGGPHGGDGPVRRTGIVAGRVRAVVRGTLLQSLLLRPPDVTAADLDARVARQPPVSEMIFLLVFVFLLVFFSVPFFSFFACALLGNGHVCGEESLFGVLGGRRPLFPLLLRDARGSQRVRQEREGLTGRKGREEHEGGEREARQVRGPRAQRKGERWGGRRRPLAAAGRASARGNDVWGDRGDHVGGSLRGRRAGHLAGRGDAAAPARLVRHLHGEGGAGGGGEGAGVAGAAGVVVGALGGGQAAGARDKVRRAGVGVLVVMGVRGAGTPHGAPLQRKHGAVRRGGRGGLRRHFLIGRQLEGSQKTCEDQICHQ